MAHRLARLTLALTGVALASSLAAATGRAQVMPDEYAARRDSVAAAMQDGVLLVLGAPEPRADYESFFQSPVLYYLTGLREPNAALVIARRGGRATTTLFVEPREPGRETWTGARLGPAGVTRRWGVAARSRAGLDDVLDSLLARTPTLYIAGDFGDDDALTPEGQYLVRLRHAHPDVRLVDLGAVVARLRSRHSPAELALLRRAAAITVLAQQEAMRAIQPGMNEYEIQALIEYTFRRHGAERPSFATIVGSGPNATTLHYNEDDRVMRAGEVVVMDIGASFAGYAADVTRTVPVSGAFTPDQRALYQVVRDAQAAAERQARLGAPQQRLDDSSRAILTQGLTRLGLIESPEATFDAAPGECVRPLGDGCAQWSLYYMHALGHGIGLEVHDPNPWDYPPRVIAPGAAFTIEPGLYVRADLLDHLPDTPRNRKVIARLRPAVERFRNVGVRIEDDYVATAQGVERISKGPRDADEVEAAMKGPRLMPGGTPGSR